MAALAFLACLQVWMSAHSPLPVRGAQCRANGGEWKTLTMAWDMQGWKKGMKKKTQTEWKLPQKIIQLQSFPVDGLFFSSFHGNSLVTSAPFLWLHALASPPSSEEK